MLTHIAELLERHVDGDEQTFLDLFAGTNAVGAYFKPRYTMLSNDLLYFSYINAVARIGLNHVPTFRGLAQRGIDTPLKFLEQEAESYLGRNVEGYYELSYSPTGGSMYLTSSNAKRVDSIRSTIAMWHHNGWTTNEENAYLVDALINAVPSVSNTTGTYGAFLKHWDKRALNTLRLTPSAIYNNQYENKCFQQDANELVKEIEADIVYIDPPYNSRQYVANYHVLENIARNSEPELRGVTRLFDWADERSSYCSKRSVKDAMGDLIASVQARHMVISYNSEGLLNEEDLVHLARSCSLDNQIEVVRVPYRRYSSRRSSSSRSVYELLLYARKSQPPSKSVTTTGLTEKVFPLIKSPLNYIGGKYRLLPQIMPLLPQSSHTFVDLFSGGANVGINASAEKHMFIDMNERINELFRYFQKTPIEQVISSIHETIDEWGLSKTNEEAFLRFRKHYNKCPDPISLYVLTSYSYNYQFRFNSNMEFNNPFGRNRSSFSRSMERNLVRFVKRLSCIDACFIDSYFEDLDLSFLQQDDFVYLDPPYLITTGSYNDGNRGFRNWNETSELSLLDRMRQLTQRGVPFALSNVLEHKGRSNELLKEFISEERLHVFNLQYNYDNASHNSKSRGSREVLVTNYRLDRDGRAAVDV
ncbi:adenine-specific DNA-methyltransferase [Brevibacterium paucivorans]|uniref:Site-specific DNA-methyltransferase (adenine-specific) n=2 Tax=Brevibacterium paucivorans TaxID=170994 RepID=A0ABS2SMC1_9MICO|nr:adenine-specific DNA-methyltransferase [Brevibacterium paucivorans]